jgi:hypothetical protein
MHTSIRCGLFFLAAAATSRGSVIVVDPGGGSGGAALLQSAIDAAQEGDILLLRPGDYASAYGSHPQIIDKGLTLIVDGPPGSVVLSGLRIHSEVPDSHVFVRGLHIEPQPLVAFPSGAVETFSMGTVWFEDCVFTGAAAVNQVSVPGLASPDVIPPFANSMTLVRCTITGADGADEVPGVSPALPGAAGANLALVWVTLHECLVQGGKGGDGDPFVGGNPGLAYGGWGLEFKIFVNGSVLGCTLQGGDEGLNNPAATQPGYGLFINISSINVRDSEIHAGSVKGAGTPAPDIQAMGSSVVYYPAALRSLAVPSPLREGESSVLHVQGEVGDYVWVVLGLSAGLEPMEFKQGNFVLDDVLPSPAILGAITDASGVLDKAFQLPILPTGIDGVLITLQSAVMPASGGFLLGSGSALVWLDAAF